MLCEHVNSCINESLSCFAFEGWVEPGLGPLNLNGCIGVNRLRTEGECVNTADNFRNRERCNVSNLSACTCRASCDTGEVASFFSSTEVCTEVLSGLVTGCPLKAGVRVVSCNCEHRVAVTERGTEDQVVAISGELLEGLLRVSVVHDVLDALHFDAEVLLKLSNALVVLVGPACVAGNTDVDNCDLYVGSSSGGV